MDVWLSVAGSHRVCRLLPCCFCVSRLSPFVVSPFALRQLARHLMPVQFVGVVRRPLSRILCGFCLCLFVVCPAYHAGVVLRPLSVVPAYYAFFGCVCSLFVPAFYAGFVRLCLLCRIPSGIFCVAGFRLLCRILSGVFCAAWLCSLCRLACGKMPAGYAWINILSAISIPSNLKIHLHISKIMCTFARKTCKQQRNYAKHQKINRVLLRWKVP